MTQFKGIFLTFVIRKQVLARRPIRVMNSLRELPNFNTDLRKFLHRRVTLEARAAARALR